MHELTRLTTAPRSAKCPHCGGESGFDPRTLKPLCEWCGGALAIQVGTASIQAEEIAPAMLNPAAARAAVEHWIKKSAAEVLPDFSVRAKILKIEGAFFPFYLFSGVYSGSRGNGMVSGGFTEMVPGSGDLGALQVRAPAFRFFAPPSDDVTLEDLSARIMNELVEERRLAVHTDFCRHVVRKATTAVLEKITTEHSAELVRHSFTEAYEVAEQRLKQMLVERTKVNDIFFQELKTRRVLWPFFTAEISCLGFKYYCFVDASSPRPEYLGGYKPIDPRLQTATIEQLRDGDLGDLLETWSSSATVASINGHTYTGDAAVEKLKEVRTLMDSLSRPPGHPKPIVDIEVKKGCFIATAAYGSDSVDDVRILQRFRDEVLSTSIAGRLFIRAYYRCSPPLARALSGSSVARKSVRAALKPLVRICRKHVK